MIVIVCKAGGLKGCSPTCVWLSSCQKDRWCFCYINSSIFDPCLNLVSVKGTAAFLSRANSHLLKDNIQTPCSKAAAI